ncbi:uncharacterized protein LOC143231046 [Tachypleus tridentatus]|uniref:uncharacterized protein LOC143231046 n=1 Tax=Tachypleus tridentatus TaxID=6853 RepID=UPI003FD2EB31
MAVFTTTIPDRDRAENKSLLWRPIYPKDWRRHFSKTYFLSPEHKNQKMKEFYETYDFMTGVRIAATLGGLITLFTLFLFYKSKCKTDKIGRDKYGEFYTNGDIGVQQEGFPTRGTTTNDNTNTASDSGSVSLHLETTFSPCPHQTDIPLTVYVESPSSLFLPSEICIEDKVRVPKESQRDKTDINTRTSTKSQSSASSVQAIKISNSNASKELSVKQTCIKDVDSQRPSSSASNK